jgi:hypothetical protein
MAGHVVLVHRIEVRVLEGKPNFKQYQYEKNV